MHHLRLPDDHDLELALKWFQGQAPNNLATLFSRDNRLFIFTTIIISPVRFGSKRHLLQKGSPGFHDLGTKSIFMFIAFHITNWKNKMCIGMNVFFIKLTRCTFTTSVFLGSVLAMHKGCIRKSHWQIECAWFSLEQQGMSNHTITHGSRDL